MLTIIIPLRNEYDNLGEIVNLVNTKLKDINFELLFINDLAPTKLLSEGSIFQNRTAGTKYMTTKKEA